MSCVIELMVNTVLDWFMIGLKKFDIQKEGSSLRGPSAQLP